MRAHGPRARSLECCSRMVRGPCQLAHHRPPTRVAPLARSDANGDGVLEFHEFSAFWSDSFGDTGDDLLRESVSSSKKKSSSSSGSSGSGGKGKTPKAKDIKLQTAAELEAKLAAAQEEAKKLEDSATDAVGLSFERRLGAALIRNDKGNELKAGKLDKYLTSLVRKWDSNGDGCARHPSPA